jgi:hypothetical protein
VDNSGLAREVSTECSDDEDVRGGCDCCGGGAADGGGDGPAVDDEEVDVLLRMSVWRAGDSSASIALGIVLCLEFGGPGEG